MPVVLFDVLKTAINTTLCSYTIFAVNLFNLTCLWAVLFNIVHSCYLLVYVTSCFSLVRPMLCFCVLFMFVVFNVATISKTNKDYHNFQTCRRCILVFTGH